MSAGQACEVAGLGAPLKAVWRLFASTFEPQRLLELWCARCRIDRPAEYRILTNVSKREACSQHRMESWNTLPRERRLGVDFNSFHRSSAGGQYWPYSPNDDDDLASEYLFQLVSKRTPPSGGRERFPSTRNIKSRRQLETSNLQSEGETPLEGRSVPHTKARSAVLPARGLVASSGVSCAVHCWACALVPVATVQTRGETCLVLA